MQRIFLNHSIKKWSDILNILNDNIICFIAFLDVFSTQNGYQKTQKIGVYLGLSPTFYHFFSVSLIFCWDVFFYSHFKTEQKLNLDYQPWYASGNVWFVLIILAKYSLLLISWLNILWRTLPPYLFTQGKQICCVGFPAIYSSS